MCVVGLVGFVYSVSVGWAAAWGLRVGWVWLAGGVVGVMLWLCMFPGWVVVNSVG